MATERKMAMVVNLVKMEDEDVLDVGFWLSKAPAQRLEEVYRLRQQYFTWTDGSFPQKMTKVVHQKPL